LTTAPGGGRNEAWEGGLNPAARAAILSLLQAATLSRRGQGGQGGVDTLVVIGRGLLTHVMGRLAQSRIELLQRDRYNLTAGSTPTPFRGGGVQGGLLEASSASDLSFAGGMYAQASAGGFHSAHVGSMMGASGVHASAASLLLTGGAVAPPSPQQWGRGMRGTAVLEQVDPGTHDTEQFLESEHGPSAPQLPYAMQQHVTSGGVAGYSRLPAPAPLLSIHSWARMYPRRSGLKPRPPLLVAGEDNQGAPATSARRSATLEGRRAPPPRFGLSTGSSARHEGIKRPDTRQSDCSAPGDIEQAGAGGDIAGPSLGHAAAAHVLSGGDPIAGRSGPIGLHPRKGGARKRQGGVTPAISFGSVAPGEWSLLEEGGLGPSLESLRGRNEPAGDSSVPNRASATLSAAGSSIMLM